jgi:hypothetical protein
MWLWSSLEPAAKHAVWLALAFVAGVLLVLVLWHPARPLVLASLPTPTLKPGAVATLAPSPPAAVATVSEHQRVVIQRPIYPPGWFDRRPDVPGAPEPSPLEETIIVEQDGGATAIAPIVTPAPVPTAPPTIDGATAGPPTDPGPRGGPTLPFGVDVGIFPGGVAVDWEIAGLDVGQLVPLSGFEGLRLGLSVVGNMNMLGAGGNASLARLHPHLYFGIGELQEFKLLLDPHPYALVGWRF